MARFWKRYLLGDFGNREAMKTLELPFQAAGAVISDRIKLSLIDVPPEYESKDALVEDDALRKSIEKSGVQQSIVVMPEGDRFTVVKGARRVRISQLIGLREIPALINEPPAGADPKAYRDRLRMILTQARQDLLPSQRADLIKQLMASFQMLQKEVAEYLGVDAGSITNWLSIDRYIPAVVKAIDTREITMHSARAFDGMTPKAQERIWVLESEAIAALPGGELHRYIRSKYSPENRPRFYISARKTLEKMSRTGKKRVTLRRIPLEKAEKEALSRDLGLREVELEDSKEEMTRLKREITLATQPIRAILRNADLLSIVPAEMKEELERFAEVYV